MSSLKKLALFASVAAIGVVSSGAIVQAAPAPSYCEYDWCMGNTCKDADPEPYNCALFEGEGAFNCSTLDCVQN